MQTGANAKLQMACLTEYACFGSDLGAATPVLYHGKLHDIYECNMMILIYELRNHMISPSVLAPMTKANNGQYSREFPRNMRSQRR